MNNIFIYKVIYISIWIILFYIYLHVKCNLSYSYISFLSFFINFIILILFLSSFFSIYQGIDDPILIVNFSKFTIYRYIIFIIITTFSVLYSIYLYKFPTISNNKYFIIPSLYQETKDILMTWETTIFGPFWEYLITNIAFNKPFKYSFLLVHFVFYYVISLTQSILLFNVVFFHGDFRYNIYLMPLSFCSWIFKHLFYYFMSFILDGGKDIKEHLIISLPKDDTKEYIISGKRFINIDLNKFKFQYSTLALSKGFHKLDLLNDLSQGFIKYGVCFAILEIHYEKCKYLSYINLSIRYICWVIVVLTSFNNSNLIIMTWPWLVFKKLFHNNNSHNIIKRNYVKQSFYIENKYQTALKEKTKGAYSPGHPVTTDKDKINEKNEIPFYHQPTHGKGSLDNPSQELSPEININGTKKPQNAVYPKNDTTFPSEWTEKEPIPGSKEYYERPDVKNNDDKNNSR